LIYDLVNEEYLSITSKKVGYDFQSLKPGIYIRRAAYSICEI